MKFIQDISGQLHQRRSQLGLSLGAVARRAGTSIPTLSRYENGWTRFELGTLRKLATALDCELVVSLQPQPGLQPETEKAAIRRLARLFWDHPFTAGDVEAHPVWVVERILDYGDLEDIRFIRKRLGNEHFLEAVSTARISSPRTRRFWEQILKLEGRTCTRAFSRDTASNF